MGVVAIVIAWVIGIAILSILAAWPVMVLWGAIAGTYDLPTMGIGTAWQVSTLAGLLFKSTSVNDN